MSFRAQHDQGEQVNPTARIATSLRTSGARQGDASSAAVMPSAFCSSKGTGALTVAVTRIRLAAATTVTLTALLLAFSAQALATTGHSFAGSFGGPGEGAGQFPNPPNGVAVGLAGDVFVAEAFSSRMDRFTATGTFQSVIPDEIYNEPGAGGDIAVDSAPAGGVYVSGLLGSTGTTVVAKYSAAGLFEYTLDPALSETSLYFGSLVAVDPANGTVYATATNNLGAFVIDSFSQTTGAFIASFNGESGSPDGGFACPTGLAVDLAHHVLRARPLQGPGPSG